MNDSIYQFVTGDGKDDKDRYHYDILAFEEEEYASTHDFIQWAFPTITASAYNAKAPLLDLDTIAALKDDVSFQTRYLLFLKQFLNSLGLEYKVRRIVGVPKPIVTRITTAKSWMAHDHHYLPRITRVMESCVLLGYKET